LAQLLYMPAGPAARNPPVRQLISFLGSANTSHPARGRSEIQSIDEAAFGQPEVFATTALCSFHWEMRQMSHAQVRDPGSHNLFSDHWICVVNAEESYPE
jgi:hypothetical protein